MGATNSSAVVDVGIEVENDNVATAVGVVNTVEVSFVDALCPITELLEFACATDEALTAAEAVSVVVELLIVMPGDVELEIVVLSVTDDTLVVSLVWVVEALVEGVVVALETFSA